MCSRWLKKLVEMPLQCTEHTLPNATQQGSTTTVSAINFNVLSTCLWRELAWCSVSHPNALPLAFLCYVIVCVRLGGFCLTVLSMLLVLLRCQLPSLGKFVFLKSQKIVDVMVPLRWPAFCSTMVTAFFRVSFLPPKWGLLYISHVNPEHLLKC